MNRFCGPRGEVATTTTNATVETVIHRLRLENIGALVVTDDGTHPSGIISERDIVRAVSEHSSDAFLMHVKDVMSHPVETCKPDSNLQDVMGTMTRRRFRHMPVMSDGVLVGIVSIGDLVKHRLEELELETNVLRDRVIGSR